MAEKKYIYATAANGMEVRIPLERYPEWKAAQDKIKAGKAPSGQEAQQIQKQLRSLITGKQ